MSNNTEPTAKITEEYIADILDLLSQLSFDDTYIVHLPDEIQDEIFELNQK